MRGRGRFTTHSQSLGHLSKTPIHLSALKLHDSPVPMGSILIQSTPSRIDGRLCLRTNIRQGVTHTGTRCQLRPLHVRMCTYAHMPPASLSPRAHKHTPRLRRLSAVCHTDGEHKLTPVRGRVGPHCCSRQTPSAQSCPVRHSPEPSHIRRPLQAVIR